MPYIPVYSIDINICIIIFNLWFPLYQELIGPCKFPGERTFLLYVFICKLHYYSILTKQVFLVLHYMLVF